MPIQCWLAEIENELFDLEWSNNPHRGPGEGAVGIYSKGSLKKWKNTAIDAAIVAIFVKSVPGNWKVYTKHLNATPLLNDAYNRILNLHKLHFNAHGVYVEQMVSMGYDTRITSKTLTHKLPPLHRLNSRNK